VKWEESDSIIEQMIKGSTGELWGVRLENSDHFGILKTLLDTAGHTGTLLDVGCGAADVSRVWKGEYTGVDLDWVVEKVANVCNPGNKFIIGDATVESTIRSLPSSDVVLMNAFLDVLENPHHVFDVLMSLDTNKIIVHRQRLTQDQAYYEIRGSYGNTEIPSSVMSLNKIVSSIRKFPNAEFYLVQWQSDFYSFMVIKNEIR